METIKTKILVLVPYYLPGYKSGGPIRSTSNMIQSLEDDFDFKVITFNRDNHTNKPYKHIIPNTWGKLGKTKIFYASPKYLSIANLTVK